MTRLPTGTPVRPLSSPDHAAAELEAERLAGRRLADGQDALKTLPVRQIEPTYWATTVSPLASFGPVPLIRVVTDSLAGGESSAP